MRSIVALFSTCVMLACSTAPAVGNRAQTPAEPLSSAVEFLLTSAATDFSRMAGPPATVRVREVRSGYIMSPDQVRQYRLCGSFSRSRAGEKVEWMSFATIRTSGYEQYVGAQALSECTRSAIVWEQGDLSTVLQSRLEATR
jgi:hypothetical protein